MRFFSVNGQSPAARFEEVVLRSIAPDGGLYVPEVVPHLPATFLPEEARSLPEIGAELLSPFLEEIPREDLLAIVHRAWPFPVPLVHLEANRYLIELFHGPTLAFKDIGARFMAGTLSYFLAQKNEHVTILVATSGDTGSAVAHGFFRTPHIDVVILYPSGKVSRLQEQQMTTLGGNIHALEVEGSFDDCQRLVKQALVDPGTGRRLTSANSINLARLLPQMSYYAWAIAQWRQAGGGAAGEGGRSGGSPPARANPQGTGSSGAPLPLVVVPSGNFGNLTAAVYAKWMGVPSAGFLAATNANDVVPQYFRSGGYRPRPSIETLSNAMDVGDPSNFIRLQFLYKKNLDAMRRDITTASVTDAETLSEIRRVCEETGRLIDPHTAVGVAAARRTAAADTPVIIAATAHPAKFPDVIRRATGLGLPLPPALALALAKPKQSTKIPADYAELKRLLLSLS